MENNERSREVRPRWMGGVRRFRDRWVKVDGVDDGCDDASAVEGETRGEEGRPDMMGVG